MGNNQNEYQTKLPTIVATQRLRMDAGRIRMPNDPKSECTNGINDQTNQEITRLFVSAI